MPQVFWWMANQGHYRASAASLRWVNSDPCCLNLWLANFLTLSPMLASTKTCLALFFVFVLLKHRSLKILFPFDSGDLIHCIRACGVFADAQLMFRWERVLWTRSIQRQSLPSVIQVLLLIYSNVNERLFGRQYSCINSSFLRAVKVVFCLFCFVF